MENLKKQLLIANFWLRQCVDASISSCCCSVTKLCLILWTPWIITCQTPLSVEFPRQEYWNGLLLPFPGDLLNSGIKLVPPALANRFFFFFFFVVQPLWKTVWRFLKKLEIELPYDPANPLLGIHTKETRSERDTCTPMFIANRFFIAEPSGKPPVYL